MSMHPGSCPRRGPRAAGALFTALAAAGVLPAQERLLVPVSQVPPAVAEWEARQRADDPSIGSVVWVRPSSAATESVLRGDSARTFAVEAFGRAFLLEPTRTERAEHVVVTGNVRGGGTFGLAFGPGGALAGSIERGDHELAVAATGVGSVHALLRRAHRDRGRHALPCATDARHEVDATAAAPGAPLAPGVAHARTGPTTIDVMVFYTPSARAGAGGTEAIRAEIALRVGLATQACIDSGVDHRYRLVHVAETPYSETGSTTDLSRFRTPGDGYMDEVHALRATYGGDLMALVIGSSSQYCGVGYLMTSASTSFNAWAFSVTVRGCLGGHTLTHEMGHNMGSHHDRPNASGPGVAPWSYGYRTPDNRYRTIMAYRPGSRVAKWSGPGVMHNGYTLGTAGDDNARSLNGVKDVVAGFWPTRTYEWTSIPGAIPGGNGVPRLTGQGTTNGAVPFEVVVTGAPPMASGVVVFGRTEANVPFLGGTVVPAQEIHVPVTGSAAPVRVGLGGLRSLPAGTGIVAQAFFLDPGAAQGVSASDGVRTTIP